MKQTANRKVRIGALALVIIITAVSCKKREPEPTYTLLGTWKYAGIDMEHEDIKLLSALFFWLGGIDISQAAWIVDMTLKLGNYSITVTDNQIIQKCFEFTYAASYSVTDNKVTINIGDAFSLRDLEIKLNKNKLDFVCMKFERTQTLAPQPQRQATAFECVRSGVDAYLSNDYDKAIADLTQAILLDTASDTALTTAYLFRGNSYLIRSDYDRAIADYEAALRLDPDTVHAKENLEIAQRRGRLEDAAPQTQSQSQPELNDNPAFYGFKFTGKITEMTGGWGVGLKGGPYTQIWYVNKDRNRILMDGGSAPFVKQ